MRGLKWRSKRRERRAPRAGRGCSRHPVCVVIKRVGRRRRRGEDTPSYHWLRARGRITGVRPLVVGLAARAPTASRSLRHGRNDSVRATGARPLARRNVRPQRPRHTLRARPPTHHWVSSIKRSEIRSPSAGRTLLRPEGRAPCALTAWLRLGSSMFAQKFRLPRWRVLRAISAREH